MDKETIYKLVDSFLVEGDEPRPIERLNQDRHLFVKNIKQEILSMLDRLDIKTLRNDLETSRDKYTYNSAVRLFKDKINKEKERLK